ncbi:LIM domain only protein 3-like protein [Leptotrombidium deliense]|uniref:LIM domain only protein 3-like protein n=2 Tax=Parasitengona TaxID=83141 RepID=A0A443SHB3_9ACAR|nr:LIM domain only protein 3-like protein [Leptotrombidium deliense]
MCVLCFSEMKNKSNEINVCRLFGNTGICSACSKTIPAFEMVMRAKGHNYHLECFACQKCSQRFCVGDRFYLFENKIVCELDYEEIISRNASLSNSLEKLKKQTENIEYTTNAGLSICNR